MKLNAKFLIVSDVLLLRQFFSQFKARSLDNSIALENSLPNTILQENQPILRQENLLTMSKRRRLKASSLNNNEDEKSGEVEGPCRKLLKLEEPDEEDKFQNLLESNDVISMITSTCQVILYKKFFKWNDVNLKIF